VESSFRRSEQEFFHQQLTRDAILQLAASSSLVIYCGAGVTIDRTGYGWAPLIASVFAPDASSHEGHPTQMEISAMERHEDPVRLASILMQYALDQEPSGASLKAHLTPLLQNRLYKSDTWRNGQLAGNICTLAASSAVVSGRPVEVITTNFDAHLEESFERQVNRWTAKIAPELSRNNDLAASDLVPRLKVWVNDEDNNPERLTRTALNESRSDEAEVNLHYLHGRVPRTGAADGHLVISEVDYAKSRPKSLDTLVKLFSGDLDVLILGASLTDPPLVDALALTKGNRKIDDVRRFVVMPRSSLGYTDLPIEQNNRIVSHLSRRCELLGTRLLVPDFRYQVAQLCEELTLYRTQAATPADVPALLTDAAGLRYGLRLLEWWDQWKEMPVAKDANKAYEELREHFAGIKHHIERSAAPGYGLSAAPEHFRLEAWVREDPQRYRRLALWATSGGPLFDEQIRRNADLELSSRNATVRTFVEGRPQHVDIADLQDRPSAHSRWNSYLSVPIYATIKGSRLPVGAMTLASSQTKAKSVLPLPKLEYMEALRELLIRAGRQILVRHLGGADDEYVGS
jgi:hypothetical protein